MCLQTKGITPAHLAPRTLGGCDDPDCVVPLCWMHHRAYDTGRLELLPYLEPRWRAEIAHAVLHLGLIGAYRRLTAPARRMSASRHADRHGPAGPRPAGDTRSGTDRRPRHRQHESCQGSTRDACAATRLRESCP